MKHVLALLILASLAIVSCKKDETTAPVETKTPFSMIVYGIGAPPPPSRSCGTGFTSLGSTGECYEPTLGRFTVIQSHCANLATGVIVDGTAVLIAANGDTLRGTYSNQIIPGAPPTLFFTGKSYYNGGTGKYAGATGEGDVQGTLNVTTGAATVHIDGWIQLK
jgi:hypothetical protein